MSIANCPECAAQFALPAYAGAEDRARCPECRAEFGVGDAPHGSLPVAQLLPPTEAASVPEVEQPVEPMVSSAEIHSAETVAFSATKLADWEERLKRAIEATNSNDHARPTPSKVVEDAPEFDFHLDPPQESLADSHSTPPVNLTDTHGWFEGGCPPAIAQEGEVLADAAVRVGHLGALFWRRRRGGALLRHFAVAIVCGAIGLLVGQYSLLWLRGPSADYIQLAQILPTAMRPPVHPPRNFAPPVVVRRAVEPEPEPRETSPIEKIARQLAESEPEETGDPAPPVASPLMQDDEVAPALAEADVEAPPLLPLTNTTPAEFAELVEAARSAVRTLLSGDLKTQESARAKGHAYMAFCRLAERFDFAYDLTLGPQAEREAARAGALFRTTAASAALQRDFAFIVTRWWQHTGRPTQGIFLTGRVENVEPVGDRTLYHVEVALPDEKTSIPVLTERAEFQAGDEIGVIGTIVANPRQKLHGFPLALPQLAVAQDTFAIALD